MEKIARNKIEMEKLRNPLKMNGIIFDAASETLSHFCMFGWQKSQEKYQNLICMEFNFCRVKINETFAKLLGKCLENNEKIACDRMSNAPLFCRWFSPIWLH